MYNHYNKLFNSEFEDTLQKAANKLEYLGCEPFDYHGYNIFVSPTIGKALKGTMKIMETKQSVLIRNILVNEEKKLITVVFVDGFHEIIKCSDEDHFDVNIGVALAIAQHLYGSKNKFHKEIEKKAKTLNKKINKEKKEKLCQKKKQASHH